MAARRRRPHTARPLPLARLFVLALRDLLDGLHERLRERGWKDVRRTYGYVLLAVREHPRTTTALAGQLGVTKQAASKLVDTMERAGYVRRSSHEADARARLVGITARGRRLLETVESIYRGIESEWAAILGPRGLEDLRSELEKVVRARHGGELPLVRPTW